MGTKQKVSENGTYVFDPEEIEQLDELSFTTVLSDAVGATKPGRQPESSHNAAPQSQGDTTINELLSGQLEPHDQRLAHSGLPSTPQRAEEAPGDLVDPDLLCPEITTSKGPNKR